MPSSDLAVGVLVGWFGAIIVSQLSEDVQSTYHQLGNYFSLLDLP